MSKKIWQVVFHKNFRTYLNINLRLYNIAHTWNFFPKLLLSYYIVIALCICSMGILSYSFVSTSIKEQAIKSNDKLLNQFKNTVDSLVLSNINDLSLKILQDTHTNPYISYYFSESLDKDIYDMVKVMEYCDTLKSINPMIFSAGIYFEKNQLLISSKCVRTTLYGKMSDQKDLLYYYNLINNNSSNTFWYADHNYMVMDSNYGPGMHSIIHMVRKVASGGNENLGGAIIISIDENVFYNIIKKTAALDLDKIIICDNKGNVISHTDKELLKQNITNFDYGARIINTSDASGNFIVNINNIPSTVSFCSSGYSNWKYITVTPIQKLNAATGFLVKIIISVALATILFGILISLIPALKLSNPLKKLVNFCKGLIKNPDSNPQNEYNLIHSTIERLALSMQEQEQKFVDVFPVLKDNLLRDLISNHYNADEVEDRMQLLAIKFPYAHYCTLVIYIKKLNTTDPPIICEYGKINIAAILEKVFNTDTSTCIHCEKDGKIAAIINFSMVTNRIYELVNSLIGQKANELSSRLFIGIGTIVENIEDINQSYLVAEAGLKYRYIFPENHIFTSHDIISLEGSNTPFDKLNINNLTTSLQAQNKSKALNEIDKIIAFLKTGKYSYSHVMDTLMLCILSIKETSAKLGIVLDAAGSKAADINTQFIKIDNINDFEKWICGLVDYLFNCIESRHSDINTEIVQKATDYIMKNIKNNQLSLQVVAKELHISTSHLSRIFKNETGVTFVDYVTDLKLYFCKDLLLRTSYKIDEISSIMGYSTPQYFINRFKIKYGYTPKEYRCKYANSIVQ